MRTTVLIGAAALLLAAPLAARQSLGVFEDWAAFRDPPARGTTERCYAIASSAAAEGRTTRPFASVGFWPDQGVRGQFYMKLSRPPGRGAPVTLTVGRRNFTLQVRGDEAWAKDRTMDAAILAAMRASRSMRARARDADGKRFADSYELAGAATAIDAATLACANRR